MAETRLIELRGESWRSEADFYSALLAALQIPDEHGHNLDVIEESLRARDISEAHSPSMITIFGAQLMGAAAEQAARRFVRLCDRLAAEGIAIDAAMAL
jgi:RNAse (barnase) inhibitor barstar